ncbi:hypothetical protein P8452_74166 [Trifolium repens]|nr:hypothetical protein P8452_74166 [Trifolium repens]
MVFMDKNGDRIHGTVRRTLIYKFENEIKEVKPAEGNSVSPLLYAIPHPSELFATDYDTNYLVDLMGRLHGVGAEKTYERNGVQSKMVVIELDNDGYRFKCTLFGEFVDVLNAFIASGETQNVIVMLMLAKVKKFQVLPINTVTHRGESLVLTSSTDSFLIFTFSVFCLSYQQTSNL